MCAASETVQPNLETPGQTTVVISYGARIRWVVKFRDGMDNASICSLGNSASIGAKSTRDEDMEDEVSIWKEQIMRVPDPKRWRKVEDRTGL